MPPPKPTLTLLTLPREIRDCIYSYLTHDVPLRNIIRLGGNNTMVDLENAPYLNVLLINSQIYHEYRETCLRKLGAKIFIITVTTTFRMILEIDVLVDNLTDVSLPRTHSPYTDERRAELDNEALHKVSSVTVRIITHPQMSWQFCSKVHMDPLLLAISEKTPLLHTLQVAEYHYVKGLVNVSFGDNDLPKQLLASFPPMELKQSVAGRRVSHLTGTGSMIKGQIVLFRALTFSTRGSRVNLWTGCLLFNAWNETSNDPGVIYAWE